jgi:glycyl-tRNA synthetase beta chain
MRPALRIRARPPRAHAARARRVLADFAMRRERIRAEVSALATSLNGRALIGEALLEEVTALVSGRSPRRALRGTRAAARRC